MSGRQGFDDGADWLLAQLAGGGATGSAPQASPPQTPPQQPSAFAAPPAPAPQAQPSAPRPPAQHEEVLDWFSLAEPPARDDAATRALPVVGEPGHPFASPSVPEPRMPAPLPPASMPPASSGLPSWTPPFTVAPPAPTSRLTEVEPPVGGASPAATAAPQAPFPAAAPMPPVAPAAPPSWNTAMPPAAPVAPPSWNTADTAMPPAAPVAPPSWNAADTAAPPAGIPMVDPFAALAAPAAPVAPATAPVEPTPPPGPVTPTAPFALTWGDPEIESEAALRAAFAQLSDDSAPAAAPSAPAAHTPAPAAHTPAPQAPLAEPAPNSDDPFAGFSAPAVARSSFTPVGGIPIQHPTAPPEAPAGWAETPTPPAASYDDELWAALNEAEPAPEPGWPAASAAPAAAPATPEPVAPPAPEAPLAETPAWTPGRAWTEFATAQPASPAAQPEFPAQPQAFEQPEPVAQQPDHFAQPEVVEPVARPSRFDAFAEELEWTPRAERRTVAAPGPEAQPEPAPYEPHQAFFEQPADAAAPATAVMPVLPEGQAQTPVDGMLSAPRAPFPAFAAANPRPDTSGYGTVPPVDDLLAALGGGAAAAAAAPAAAPAAAAPVYVNPAPTLAGPEADGLDELGLSFGDDEEPAFAEPASAQPVVDEPAYEEPGFARAAAAAEPAVRRGLTVGDAQSFDDDEADEVAYLWNLRPDPDAEDPRADSSGSVASILASSAPALPAGAFDDEAQTMGSGLGSLVRVPAALQPEPEAQLDPVDEFSDVFAPGTAAFEQPDEVADPQYDARFDQQFPASPFAEDRFDAQPAGDHDDDGLSALFGSVAATGPLQLIDPSVARAAAASPATALLQTAPAAQLFAGAAGSGAGGAGGAAGAGGAGAGGYAGGPIRGGGSNTPANGGRGPAGPSYGSGSGSGGAAGGSGSSGSGGGRGIRPLVWVAGGLVAVLVLVGLFFLGTTLTKSSNAAAPSGSPSASASETPAAAPTAPQPAGVHAWNTLFGGECVDPFTNAWQDEYTVVDCAAPHAAQLVYRGTLPGDAAAPYPGEAELAAQMNLLCTAPGVIDVAAVSGMADLQVQGSYPATAEQWEAGARDYYCFANRSGGELLTASIAGAGPAV
ncbi:hypothetical protein ACFVTX_11440 [Agromyces sp. NPDC058136]|uniref:hypothetical protein n=1 Tax=Agromyces sp. NPDC058136 TaxID=3346354 RepID=UPI0036DCDDDD